MGMSVVMAKSNGVAMMREIERKYEAIEGLELLDPAGLLGFDTATGPHEQDLAAVYFDTADLRLVRAGVTLRRREGGSDAGWHLKLPAGKDSREELRLPLGRSPRRPPAELIALIRVHTRGAVLVPIAELTTRRRRWVLADSTGRSVAELVDDRVHARTVGKQTTSVSWREVEVELGEHGQQKLLDRIERRLLKMGAQRAGSSSKLGRLLADRMPPSIATPSPDLARSAGEVVLAYLRAQAQQLRRYDPLVRRDAPDAVHQMRVAARRMRSALQTFGRVIDRDQTRELTAELKWVAGELAGARDAEVMAERFAAILAELPDELKLGPVEAAFTRSFERRQADAHDVAVAALDSEAAKRLRYATEAVQPTLDKPAARLRKRLKSVQELLGEHQDTAVSRPVLRELAAQAHLNGGNGFTYGLMYATEAARAEQAENNLPPAWKRMRKPKNTAWLKS